MTKEAHSVFFFFLNTGENDFQHQDLNFSGVTRAMQLSRGAAKSYVSNIIFFYFIIIRYVVYKTTDFYMITVSFFTLCCLLCIVIFLL